MGVENYNKQQLERLREHKIAFDQEAMWAAMQKKKKRRGALYFFTMALVALAIVFFTCMIFFKFNNGNTTLEKGVSVVDRENPKNREILNDENESQTKLANEIKTQEVALLAENPSKSVNLNSNEDIGNSNLKSGDSNDNTKSLQSSEEVHSSMTTIYNQPKELTKEEFTNAKNSRSEENPNGALDESSSKEDNPIDNEVDIDQGSTKIINQNNVESSNLVKGKLENLLRIEPLKVNEFPFLESLSETEDFFGELELSVPEIIEVAQVPKSRFQIGAYGGVGYLFRQTNLESNTSMVGRETLEEVSIGLELKYQLTPIFFVRSGVEYWHATESQENSTSSIANIKDLETLPDGFVETDNGILITNSYTKIHTIYQSYNIPVVLGWNTNNDKWNISVEAGVMYNFRTERRRNELLFPEDGDLYQIGSQNQITPTAGFGLTYSPVRNMELFVRANWRGNQFVTSKESDLSLKFGAVRTQLGIRIGI